MSRYRTNTKKPTNRKKKYREGGPVGEPVMLDEVDVVAPKFKPKGMFKGLRRRIARNVHPYSYRNAPFRFMKAALGLKEPDADIGPSTTERQALLDLAMGQPIRDESIGALSVSEYQPSNSSDPSAVYFRSPMTEDEIKDKIKHIDDIRLKGLDYSTTLGNYTIGSGKDEKGRYISYYDLWDLDPFQHSKKLKRFEDEAEQLQSAIGVTSPEVYGRLYYKKNPDGSITYLDGKGRGSKKKYRNETKKD